MELIKNSIFPLNRIIRTFMEQTMNQLELNVITQTVFPNEIYRGFSAVNDMRHAQGKWYAEGKGVRSFRSRLVSADEAGNVTLVFNFNDYLRYVDMGVGQGTKYEDVQSNKKARYQSRYVSVWDRAKGQSQRPAIMMELRHLQRRIMNYLVDFYGYEGETQILRTFEGIGGRIDLGF